MAHNPTAAADAARRLWIRTAGDATDPVKVAAAAERLCGALGVGLGRWIGQEGYRALLRRALATTRADHPALGSLQCLNEEEPVHKIVTRPNGPRAVADGIVALVTALIELLGKIIGEEMAMRLVEQTGMSSPRRLTGNQAQGGRNG